MAFGVVNVRNQFIRIIVDLLYRLTEPVLRPIRASFPTWAASTSPGCAAVWPVLRSQPAVGIRLAGPRPLTPWPILHSLRRAGDGVTIEVRVHPRARRTALECSGEAA